MRPLSPIQETGTLDWTLANKWNAAHHFRHNDTFTYPSHTLHIPKRNVYDTLAYKWLLALVAM